MSLAYNVPALRASASNRRRSAIRIGSRAKHPSLR
jgi:hypothetical protein